MLNDPDTFRRVMVKAAREHLVQDFLNRGFQQHPLPPQERKSALAVAFPLGRLKRPRNGDLEIVEIQFDKHRRPRFVINFGIVPEQGVDLPWGQHLSQQEADVSASPEAYRLYSSRFRQGLFGPSLFAARDNSSATKAVRQALGLLPEVQRWFETKSVGPHMGRFGLP